ncbi:MAG: hypothetical protein HY461_01050 [Parcubacteria group bacterium]|nr:hypothetical protein [Parcubacteria group bacterium]
MYRKAKLVLISFLLAAGFLSPALANEIMTVEGELHTWYFDAATIGRGYTVSSPDEQFYVGVLPGVLKGETAVEIKIFDHEQFQHRETYVVNSSGLDGSAEEAAPERISIPWPLPEGKIILSPVYEFNIQGAADLYDSAKPLWLRVHYPAETNEHKGVYYFDKGKQQWILIPTTTNHVDMSLRAAIHLTYAPIAVLADEIPAQGIASWYKYHDCNCAASRDYPYGTLLTVTDAESAKSVIVEVNDYGPEAWTGRIIDLDVTAFARISNKGKGLTEVTVAPYIPTPEEVEAGLPNLYEEAL